MSSVADLNRVEIINETQGIDGVLDHFERLAAEEKSHDFIDRLKCLDRKELFQELFNRASDGLRWWFHACISRLPSCKHSIMRDLELLEPILSVRLPKTLRFAFPPRRSVRIFLGAIAQHGDRWSHKSKDTHRRKNRQIARAVMARFPNGGKYFKQIVGTHAARGNHFFMNYVAMLAWKRKRLFLWSEDSLAAAFTVHRVRAIQKSSDAARLKAMMEHRQFKAFTTDRPRELKVALWTPGAVELLPPKSVHDSHKPIPELEYRFWETVLENRPRAKRLTTWMRALEAHRDAEACKRAARDGRPIELEMRLTVGKHAGGLEMAREELKKLGENKHEDHKACELVCSQTTT